MKLTGHNKKAGDLELGGTYNSAIDDSSKLHLLSPQAVEVQGQALKQALVTQLQQPGSKCTVCREDVRGHMILAVLSGQDTLPVLGGSPA